MRGNAKEKSVKRTNSRGDGALAGEIALVAGECDDDVGAALALQLAHPRLGLVEGLAARDVKDDDRSLCAAVVHRGQRVVTFLAGTVVHPWEKKNVSE